MFLNISYALDLLLTITAKCSYNIFQSCTRLKYFLLLTNGIATILISSKLDNALNKEIIAEKMKYLEAIL